MDRNKIFKIIPILSLILLISVIPIHSEIIIIEPDDPVIDPIGSGKIGAEIDLDPDILIQGQSYDHLIAHIELPNGYDVNTIKIDTVKISTINAQGITPVFALESPTAIGDYDSDQIADLTVNFDYSALEPLFPLGSITININGELEDGTIFLGEDTIELQEPSQIDCIVDLTPDSVVISQNYDFVTAYIELPEGYNVNSIKADSVIVYSINGQAITPIAALGSPTAIGDYDDDQAADLMIKFEYASIKPLLSLGSVQIQIKGELTDLTKFSGDDTLLVEETPSPVSATIDIDPNVINLQSNGNFITAYIELSDGYDVNQIKIDTVKISKIESQEITPINALASPTAVGDYDSDSDPDLMVKFDFPTLKPLLQAGEATIEIKGNLMDNTEFTGTDIVTIQESGSDPIPEDPPEEEPPSGEIVITITFDFTAHNFNDFMEIDINLPEGYEDDTVEINAIKFIVIRRNKKVYSKTIILPEPILVSASVDEFDMNQIAWLVFRSKYNLNPFLFSRRARIRIHRKWHRKRYTRHFDFCGRDIVDCYKNKIKHRKYSRRCWGMSTASASSSSGLQYNFSLTKHVSDNIRITKALLWLKSNDVGNSWYAWFRKALKTWDEIPGNFGKLNYSNLKRGNGYEWDLTDKVQGNWENGITTVSVKLDEKDFDKSPLLVVSYELNGTEQTVIIEKKEEAKKEQNLKSIGQVINLAKESDAAIESDVITLSYSDSNLDEVKEEELGVYYWDEAGSKWEPVPDSVVDTENNCVTCSIDRKTSYQIMAPKLSPNISAPVVQNVPNQLGQNYPNPFNPATTIEYSIANDCHVTLKLYNAAGELVATVVNEFQLAGNHSVYFDGGESLPRGIYFYQLVAGGFVDTKRMVVLK
ncbi:MAG: T9SS type A sorting domain-containing protein [Endomicrobiales bacterium]|nr:T9SS type A sorting domain-containing protein [Endomicrobiales bacterium]